MASKMVTNLRRMIRSKPSEWLEDCISPMGRATAAGWNIPGTMTPHTEGAITIALIRAELQRRQKRADRRVPAHWRASADQSHFDAVAARMREGR